MKCLTIVLLICGICAGQTTPNLGLNIPATGAPNWGPLLNANSTKLDQFLSAGVFAQLNGVRTVDGVKYANIAAAIASLPAAGGFIIRLPSGYRETFTSHYILGDGVAQSVFLVMDADVKLNCAVTDGSYCFGVHDKSGIGGISMQQFVDRSGGSVISLASTLNVTNVIQTLDNPQGAIYLRGFNIDNVNGGAVSGAFINLLNLNDASVIRDVGGYYVPHIGINVSSTTGGIKSIGPFNIDNCYFNGVGAAGARPLVIQSDGSGATNNVNVIGGYWLNPGSSNAAIEINGGGGTTGALQQILISGAYTQQSTGTTTVTGIKIVDAAGVTIQTSSFQVTDGTAGHTGISINQSGAGRTHSIVVHNFRLDAAGGNIGLNNIITSETLLNATGSGNIPGYVYQGTSGTQLPSPFVFGGDTTVSVVGTLSLGPTGTNNFKLQPAATAGSRVITLADPLQATVALPMTIASGTKALNTASITTATCDAGVAVTATGTLSTDTVNWSFNAAPTATNKYGAFLIVYAVPSANTVTFYTCNPSATTSTPTAMTVNWTVVR